MLLIVGTVTSLALVLLSLDALNCMNRRTPHWDRLAYVCVACGAFGAALDPFYGNLAPSVSDVCLRVGVMLACVASRRRRAARRASILSAWRT